MTYSHTFRSVRPGDPVNALMSWPVACVEDSDSLAEVSRELAADEIGAVLVLHQGVLVGVLSERDVAEEVGTKTDPGQLTAGEVMSPDLVTVPPEAPIFEAARIMRETQVRHLPVVSDGLIAGILSMRDLFHALLDQAEASAYDSASPTAHVETAWRHYQRDVWFLTCPVCEREDQT